MESPKTSDGPADLARAAAVWEEPVELTEEDVSAKTQGFELPEAANCSKPQTTPWSRADRFSQDKRIRRKTDKVILAILVWVYFLQILDKSILGYGAVFGLQEDTQLRGNQYSVVGSIAAMAQLAWQPFSMVLIVTVPHRVLMPSLVLCWGAAQVGMAACRNYAGLLATRFLLGLFEGGCLPLFSIITSQWYRRAEQPLRVAAWYGTNGLATIVASSLSYGLGHIPSETLKSWQMSVLPSLPPSFYLLACALTWSPWQNLPGGRAADHGVGAVCVLEAGQRHRVSALPDAARAAASAGAATDQPDGDGLARAQMDAGGGGGVRAQDVPVGGDEPAAKHRRVGGQRVRAADSARAGVRQVHHDAAEHAVRGDAGGGDPGVVVRSAEDAIEVGGAGGDPGARGGWAGGAVRAGGRAGDDAGGVGGRLLPAGLPVRRQPADRGVDRGQHGGHDEEGGVPVAVQRGLVGGQHHRPAAVQPRRRAGLPAGPARRAGDVRRAGAGGAGAGGQPACAECAAPARTRGGRQASASARPVDAGTARGGRGRRARQPAAHQDGVAGPDGPAERGLCVHLLIRVL
ncbi:hypothetical protein LOZ01_005735 [Ophidiomyces ophidiicola]|nr:hypothetical protein LOZ01_005735 [Ophidiomyces ophidiicola]